MSTNYRWNTDIPKFTTDIEKKMHKIVSGLRYGEAIRIPTEKMSADEVKETVKALRKSGKWNCIELKVQTGKVKNCILVSVNNI
jgi:hypothetical protein